MNIIKGMKKNPQVKLSITCCMLAVKLCITCCMLAVACLDVWATVFIHCKL